MQGDHMSEWGQMDKDVMQVAKGILVAGISKLKEQVSDIIKSLEKEDFADEAKLNTSDVYFKLAFHALTQAVESK